MHYLAKPQHLPATISSGTSESSHPSDQAKRVSLVEEMPMLYQTPSDTPKTEVARINFEPQHGFLSFKPL